MKNGKMNAAESCRSNIKYRSASDVCSRTCQTWTGDWRCEPRLNRVVCEYFGTSALDACSMSYKKVPSTQDASCEAMSGGVNLDNEMVRKNANDHLHL